MLKLLAKQSNPDLNAIVLQLLPFIRPAAYPIKVALTGYLLACVMVIGLMAAGLDFHLEVHRDACDGNHQCAITLFTHGQVELTDAACDAPERMVRPVIEPQCSEVVLVNSTDFLLLPGRAPPAFC
jgi:hypothetical protein